MISTRRCRAILPQHSAPRLCSPEDRQATLTMETLSDRLDAVTLTGLLVHLKNHLALREGRADMDRRQPAATPKKPTPAR